MLRILPDRSDRGKASGRERGPSPHLADNPSPESAQSGPATYQVTISGMQGTSAWPDWEFSRGSGWANPFESAVRTRNS
jgi:hypothetical protein